MEPKHDKVKISENLRGNTIIEDRTEVLAPLRLHASWPAIIAGLMSALAIVWLLTLLGTAIGASILDETDGNVADEGFGLGAIIWMVFAGLAGFFVGGLVTGRLCGQDDDQAGLLHGVAMWGTASMLVLLLSVWGVSGLLQTGANIVAGTAGAASSVASAIPAAASSAEGAMPNQDETRMLTGIGATVKRQIAEAVAADGDAAITKEEAQRAMDQLDSDALQQIGMAYVEGDSDAAKDALAANTNLSRQQINQLSDTISKEIDERVTKYKEKIAAAAEQASDYAQGALWTTFVTAALALVASILGSMVGCREAVRLHTVAAETHRVRLTR